MKNTLEEIIASIADKPCFFWLFDPRFDILLKQFTQYLCEKEQKDYVPIIVRSFKSKGDLQRLCVVLGGRNDNVVYQEEPEDLNRLFTEVVLHGGLLERIAQKQGVVHIVSFTSENLPDFPCVKIWGAHPSISRKFNSKAFQHMLFTEAGVPVPDYAIFDSFYDLKQNCQGLLNRFGSFTITPERTAGGCRMILLSSEAQFKEYEQQLTKEDMQGQFIASRYIKAVQSPASHACVTAKGEVVVFGVADQLLNGFKFDGLVFPSVLGNVGEIEGITRVIGGKMGEQGYRGYYNLDFVVDEDGRIFTIELNARFAFGTIIVGELMKGNLFGVMDGDEVFQPLELDGRVALFKVRPPLEGAWYNGFRSDRTADEFFRGEVDRIREFYWDDKIWLDYGSYLGMAGGRFEGDIEEFYIKERYFGRGNNG